MSLIKKNNIFAYRFAWAALILFCHASSWAVEPFSKPLEANQPTIKGSAPFSIIKESIEQIKKGKVFSCDLNKITLEDLKEFNKIIAPSDEDFDYWTHLILLSEQYDSFTTLITQARTKGLSDEATPYSQYLLGCMHQDGIGIQENKQEAFNWYLKSAQRGNSMAQFSLGCMYYEEMETAESLKKARRWYLKSARQGNAMARLTLGIIGLKG